MNKDQEEAIRELKCLQAALAKDVAQLGERIKNVELLEGSSEENKALEATRLKAMQIHWQTIDIPMRCMLFDLVRHGK